MAQPPFKVRALYSYASPHDDDLNFAQGQIIIVTEEEDSDWYYGEYVDASGATKQGIFPRNFVERVEPDAPPRPARSQRVRKGASSVEEASRSGIPQDEPSAVQESPKRSEASLSSPQPTQQSPIGSAKTFKGSSIHDESGSPPELSPLPAQVATQREPAPSSSAEKPTPNSFKDRIAAFNKTAAPPIAPFKPTSLSSGASGFVKKPYVPPPPSRDAYIPPARETPQKVYRREEEAEPETSKTEDARSLGQASQLSEDAGNRMDDLQPKPTSLKERIALLQKQQLENAVRQSEVAQRKELPTRPPKPRMGSYDDQVNEEVGSDADDLQATLDADTYGGRSVPTLPSDNLNANTSSQRKITNVAVAHTGQSTGAHDFPSDANDADQSGIDELAEDAEGTSTGQDENDKLPTLNTFPLPAGHNAAAPHDIGTTNERTSYDAGDRDQGNGQEIDPEVKRRMEIRERMAKMSGGMGMHGMFGILGGMPRAGPGGGLTKEKVTSDSSEHKSTEPKQSDRGERAEPTQSVAPFPVLPPPPVPLTPSIGQPDRPTLGNGGVGPAPKDAEQMMTDMGPAEDQGRKAEPRSPPPTRYPIIPTSTRPKRPSTSRKATSATDAGNPGNPSGPLSPSLGSESDDEMSLYSRTAETITDRPFPRAELPMESPFREPTGLGVGHGMPTSPISHEPDDNDTSQALIVSGLNVKGLPSKGRPPPPPPPHDPPRTRRVSTGDTKASKNLMPVNQNATEEEITEYDGDYDTDIASSATHKTALKSSAHEQQLENVSNVAGYPAHSSPVQIASEVAPSAPRVPPSQPGAQFAPTDIVQPNVPTNEVLRAAPPPIPAPRQEPSHEGDIAYDPYRYTAFAPRTSDERSEGYRGPQPTLAGQKTEDGESFPDSISGQERVPIPPRSPRREKAVMSDASVVQGRRSLQNPVPPQQSAAPLRPSHEVHRSQTTTRRSMEQSRVSGDQGHIATDVDLGGSSLWWVQADKAPPIFQDRTDLIYEVEESRKSRRGGKTTVSKDVYTLFQDYSQTVVTARFDLGDEEDVTLEQRHEPPPSRLRQDQLEEWQTKYGCRIADEARSKLNSVVGDGNPQTLIVELIKPLSDVLKPIGTRAYGALIYLNLANASVQQYDEIRAGDVLSFRNARFQGHRGSMHQKYNMDVGKPDHVGIVMDWDGTKKKVRAWEQGREGKKVKLESFKLGDLRSGEVKVWRVVGRSWVGWGDQS